jgi:hypothetical protein
LVGDDALSLIVAGRTVCGDVGRGGSWTGTGGGSSVGVARLVHMLSLLHKKGGTDADVRPWLVLSGCVPTFSSIVLGSVLASTPPLTLVRVLIAAATRLLAAAAVSSLAVLLARLSALVLMRARLLPIAWLLLFAPLSLVLMSHIFSSGRVGGRSHASKPHASLESNRGTVQAAVAYRVSGVAASELHLTACSE